MANFGPPGGGSPEPWGGRRPEDEYSPPADPRYDPGYAAQPGRWGEPPYESPYEPPARRYEPPTQRYEPSSSWDGGQPTGPATYQGYPAAEPGYGGQPPYGEPTSYGGQPPYPEPAPYGEPTSYAEPAPPKRGKGPLVTVLAVLLVLALGGAGAFWYLGRDRSTAASGTGAPASPATDPTGQASEPADPVTTAPAPASSTDPRFVKAGQCLRNEGGAEKPKLVITECGAKTYQVLRRIDGETSGRKDAEAKCAKVDGYTDWYFFDSQLDTLDFVLCLKRH
ncbi:flagellar basal body protein FliL [Micromonospora sp. NPDC007271]|uniref:LppU/SCO3897 family protein n=1 Tax=Micromonospora sp. NPDC007271 TaxID=3154587 RepID=UPI0033F450EC